MAAWAMPCSLWARQVGSASLAACSASPMAETLPWPKIAQTPAKYGTCSPSTTTCCAASQRTVAWAAVRRMRSLEGLFMADSLPDRGSRRRPPGVAPGLDQACEAGRQLGDGGFVIDPSGQPAQRDVAEDRAPDREA